MTHFAADAHPFIRANLTLTPIRGVPEVSIYTAHPGSGLARLGGDAAPYWAYPWAGGAALARHVLDNPKGVERRRVLDLGAGSGMVGIAAMKAGAHSVLAAEIDPLGRAALGLNAAANGVTVSVAEHDVLEGPLPDVHTVLGGDVFYSRAVAGRVSRFLELCVDSGITVLVGDPGRAPLPLKRLVPLAEYAVPDFGDGASAPLRKGTVFGWTAQRTRKI
ncbi:methyltransferase [Mesorhizobium sp. NBSH29]|uniref:class I SAM-dependent methyltransferase n=1 Tax=Mesorhizobium sp. NBSH29 TaxID=2654249 RepID=UPI001896615C|nr:50S ribosomal protein L11 methyltransferase [Mesorhizobium sp. NBSH29]QPC88265.1 methyltransferase [Mesorhizobium sp. NBSH29]